MPVLNVQICEAQESHTRESGTTHKCNVVTLLLIEHLHELPAGVPPWTGHQGVHEDHTRKKRAAAARGENPYRGEEEHSDHHAEKLYPITCSDAKYIGVVRGAEHVGVK